MSLIALKLGKEKGTISLNSNSFKESPSELLIYESKNSRNLHYLSYAFSLFLGASVFISDSNKLNNSFSIILNFQFSISMI